ncbi:NAD(P)-dependent oxidoreductase [uncultured Dialister sp.]|uniref:NAD(P)-dependent oxidoreductase n=1 Tax=uncultured Dialister sp. TaxID=278064 RepID=UPI00261E2DB8|nr:NAD(P)-dependent oxidoreductase [uncultured Dialister sp.]
MKIAVAAANGKEGRLIVKEALERGMDVTAIVRSANQTEAKQVIQKDIMDLTKEDLQGFDVVVDAFGVWDPSKMNLHSVTLGHLADILSGSHTRLLVVGGAGSLYTDKTHSLKISETPDFPKEYLPVANGMGQALDELRKRKDVKWTYISPAAVFDPEGKRTGSYTLAGEEFTVNAEGQSYISYADYAIALVDEAEKGNHIGERISVRK